ncbi:hypothetical protein ACIQUC_16345 [Curtobacterium sp. NPDC098951]|uniref:hypothetical protein n=1 Tax=Curtobacterium sp. NPDC098951 TaxID=3363974 RepID=UPI00380CDC6A
MSSEPPVGDDLQQMIVGMRERFVAHLDAEPRRASVRKRVGIAVAVLALLGVGTASGAVALGMIPSPIAAPPAPSASGPAAVPPPDRTASSAPIRPTTEPSAPASAGGAASIPGSCAAAVPARDAARLFGSLQAEQIRPVAPGETAPPYWVDPEEPFVADATLVCRWSATGSTEEVDNLFLAMGSTSEATLGERLRADEQAGWTCTDRLGGRACQHSESSDHYGDRLETTHTFFVRGDTWISVTQTNTPTDGLLDVLVRQTWR